MSQPISRQALIIFVKNTATDPIAPQADAPLTATYHQLLKLSRQMPFKKYIFYDKFIDNEDIWENDIHEKRLQEGTVVAEKIKKALDLVLNQEACKRAVVISSACPAISSQVLTKAFMALESHDVVLGPRTDGDYYLLGMSEIHNEVFENTPQKDITIVRNAFNELHSINKSVYILPNLDIEDNNDQGFNAENSL